MPQPRPMWMCAGSEFYDLPRTKQYLESHRAVASQGRCRQLSDAQCPQFAHSGVLVTFRFVNACIALQSLHVVVTWNSSLQTGH